MTQPQAESGQPVVPSAAAPAPQANFVGLDFTHWGAGHPPDPNGDVGPNHYIQTVNTSTASSTRRTARSPPPSPSTTS